MLIVHRLEWIVGFRPNSFLSCAAERFAIGFAPQKALFSALPFSIKGFAIPRTSKRCG
jgi:hypothetical protein